MGEITDMQNQVRCSGVWGEKGMESIDLRIKWEKNPVNTLTTLFAAGYGQHVPVRTGDPQPALFEVRETLAREDIEDEPSFHFTGPIPKATLRVTVMINRELICQITPEAPDYPPAPASETT